jgi:hypothetical protein
VTFAPELSAGIVTVSTLQIPDLLPFAIQLCFTMGDLMANTVGLIRAPVAFGLNHFLGSFTQIRIEGGQDCRFDGYPLVRRGRSGRIETCSDESGAPAAC